MKHKFLISLLLITAMYIVTVPIYATNIPSRELMTAEAISREENVIKYGIDVSRWQGDIDWSLVAKTNAEFVILRGGVGEFDEDNPISMDSRFREYIAGASEQGLDVGVYFYSYASTIAEIRKEARFFVNMLKDFRITYPVILDMEEEHIHYKDDPAEMARAFLDIITEAGYFPMLYSYKSWLERYHIGETLHDITVWVAQLDSPSATYRGNYYMWQYSHTGRVSGIDGDVDLNISFRDFSGYIKRHGLNGL